MTRHGLLKVWSPLLLIKGFMKSHQPILNDGENIRFYIFQVSRRNIHCHASQ
jgi:hypothetical protein